MVLVGAGEYYEEDEMIMDRGVEGGVFHFLGNAVVALDKFHKEVGQGAATILSIISALDEIP